MLVVREWLKDYIGDNTPSVSEIENLLTFHAFEIEGNEKVGGMEIIDIDVLPNRSSDCLCHRGIAHEIAALTGRQLTNDPFAIASDIPVITDRISVKVESGDACRRFGAALMEGLRVKESPDWLKKRLAALGQRPINNIVDATNYVMFALGQPLHAYDADKFPQRNEVWEFCVRMARDKERIITLTGEEYELDPSVQLITDASGDIPVGIAGVKGGEYAEIDSGTTSVIIEAANFDPTITRKTSQKLRLQTDASKRFENAISPNVVPYALKEIVHLLEDIGGGTCEGYVDVYPEEIVNAEVHVSLELINKRLGLSLTESEIVDILTRLSFKVETHGTEFSVTAPFERTDINISEDIIEEVGRVYGYEHVASVVPEKVPLKEVNSRQYYSEAIRSVLIELGFSEVITSTFRKKDDVRLANALASDKGCLRSSLQKNIREALDKNVQNIDLLGIPEVRIFEIGTVFKKNMSGYVEEHVSVALGACSKQQGHSPGDDAIVNEALSALEDALESKADVSLKQGIAEFDLSALLEQLPVPESYRSHEVGAEVQYKPFSTFPFISRDIALWVSEDTKVSDVEDVLNNALSNLRVTTTFFDEFKKDGRISYAFRLVFQSHDRTLTDSEVNKLMEDVIIAIKKQNWEMR